MVAIVVVIVAVPNCYKIYEIRTSDYFQVTKINMISCIKGCVTTDSRRIIFEFDKWAFA